MLDVEVLLLVAGVLFENMGWGGGRKQVVIMQENPESMSVGVRGGLCKQDQ